MQRRSETRPTRGPWAEGGTHWTERVYAASQTIALIIQLNVLVLVFTLAGAAIAGAAPALVAASTCVRKHVHGTLTSPWTTFATTWRQEFTTANRALGAVIIAAAVLGWSYLSYSLAGEAATPMRVSTLVALALVCLILSWAPTMTANYDVPARRLVLLSLRFAITNPVLSLLQVVALLAITAATPWLPALPLFASFGAWAYVTSRTALYAFAENEALLNTSPTPLDSPTRVR